MLKFATLWGQFLSKNERQAAERNLLVSHSTKRINDYETTFPQTRKITYGPNSSIGLLLFHMLNSNIFRTSRAMCIFSSKRKNKKN